jgi:hypothetical protein
VLTINTYREKPCVKHIPLSDCKHGWLYKIQSRNLIMGVFNEEKSRFVGIRGKFDQRFLFVEYHWDTGPPFGTVKPLECLEPCPIRNLDEYIETPGGELETNSELFEWLKQRGGIAPAWVNRRKHLEDIRILLEGLEKQEKKGK